MHNLKSWYNEWKGVIWIAAAVNAAAYAAYITQETYATDDYIAFFRPSIGITCGRWLIDVIHTFVFQKNLMPSFMPFLCIAASIGTGLALCGCWKIQNKTTAAFVILLWSVHPYFFDTYQFRFSAFPYALCYTLAVAALLSYRRRLRGSVFAVVLLVLSLSIYQIAISVVAAIVMTGALMNCVRDKFSNESLRKEMSGFIRFCLIAVISAAIYWLLMQIIFSVVEVDVNSRLTGQLVNTKNELVEKTGWTFIMLAVRLLPVPEYILPLGAKLAMFVLYLLGLGCIIRKRRGWLSAAAAAVWLMLISLTAIAPVLPLTLAVSDLPWRICLGLAAMGIGLFVLTQESSQGIKKTGLVLAAVLLMIFVVTGNRVFYRQHLVHQKDCVMASQMACRLQGQQGYFVDMPLAIVGRVHEEGFSRKGKDNWEIVKAYIRHCSMRTYSFNVSAFETDWSKYAFLLNYMDLDFKQCFASQLQQAEQWAQGRKPWPDPSSVFIQEGVAVIVLSKDVPQQN